MLLKILLGVLAMFTPTQSTQADKLEDTIIKLSTVVNLPQNQQAFITPQKSTPKTNEIESTRVKGEQNKNLEKATQTKPQNKKQVDSEAKSSKPKKDSKSKKEVPKKIEGNKEHPKKEEPQFKKEEPKLQPEKKPQREQKGVVIDETSTFKKSTEHKLPYSIAHYNQSFLNKINNLRKNLGLAPVKLNQSLIDAAMIRARENKQIKDISHTRPNGSPFHTVYNKGYLWIAENLAGQYVFNQGADSTEGAFQSWVRSPGHYSVMVDENAQEIGIGVVPSNALIDANGNLVTDWPSEIWVLLLRKP